MANIRYFNLKAFNNVKVKNLEIKNNLRRVFDPTNSDWSDHGDLNAATSLPHRYLGVGRGKAFLSTGFDLGGIATTSVDTIDYGTIA